MIQLGTYNKHTYILTGITIGIIFILIYMINQVLDLSMNMLAGIFMFILNLVVLFIGIYLAVRIYKNAHEKPLTFITAFKLSISITFVASIIYAVFCYVYQAYIDDFAMLNKVLEAQEKEMISKGMRYIAIEKAVKYAEYVGKHPLVLIGSTVLTYMFVGLIISMVISSILRNKEMNDTGYSLK